MEFLSNLEISTRMKNYENVKNSKKFQLDNKKVILIYHKIKKERKLKINDDNKSSLFP